MRLRATVEIVTLDCACESPTFGSTNHVNHLAVSKLINQHLVTNVGAIVRRGQSKFFKNTCRRNSTASLLEVAAHRLGDVSQLQRLIIYQPELHCIVAVRA